MIIFNSPKSLAGMNVMAVEALKTVIDPELHVNIVDLGLVYEIKVDDVNTAIVIEMTLSSRNCPMSESILSAVKNCMERTFPEYTTQVNLVWDPEWGYESISEAGIKKLRGL